MNKDREVYLQYELFNENIMKIKSLLLAMTVLWVAACNDTQNAEPTLKTSTDVLTISTHDEFISLQTDLVKMSKEQFATWEKSKHFVSLRTVLAQAYRELDLAESESEYRNVLDRYRDVLVEEEGAVKPRLEFPFLQSIVNREGIYITGPVVNKIIADYVITANISDMEKIRTIASLSDPRVVDKKVHSFRFVGEKLAAGGRTKAACTSNNSVTLQDVSSNKCKDHREIVVRGQNYVTTWTDAGGTYYQPRVLINIRPHKKNLFCSWVDYETELERANTSFSIWAYERTGMSPYISTSIAKFVEVSVPNDYQPNNLSLVWDNTVGDWRYNQYTGPTSFTSLHIEGKSRGVEQWAIVDCN